MPPGVRCLVPVGAPNQLAVLIGAQEVALQRLHVQGGRLTRFLQRRIKKARQTFAQFPRGSKHAGGGFAGGQVIGSSDARGEEVKDRPVYPTDLISSIYTQLGIDLHASLPHPLGRSVFVAPSKEENVRTAGMLREIMGARA